MKAFEVVKNKPVKVLIPTIETKVVENNLFMQRKSPRPIPSLPIVMHQDIEENIFGVNTLPGHPIRRDRKKNNDMWQKIKNWD